jgi:hypothetical protein
VSINRTLSMAGEFAPPKTTKSRRRIQLTAGSAAALKAHRKRQVEQRLRLTLLWQDQDLIFPSTIRPNPLPNVFIVGYWLTRADVNSGKTHPSQSGEQALCFAR